VNFVFETRLTQGADVVNASVTISTDADGKVWNESLAVGAGATVNYTGMAGDPDNVKCYEILPTFSGTLTTTNSSGGADVIPLVANKPIAWNNAMGWTNGHFANRNPWTNWAFANTDAAAGTVKILIGRDDTP
jgi:hypothetical protein